MRSLTAATSRLHLARDDHPETHMTTTLYVHVDNAEQLAADWRRAGMEVVGPHDYDYGKREGSHTDPDGNVIGSVRLSQLSLR